MTSNELYFFFTCTMNFLLCISQHDGRFVAISSLLALRSGSFIDVLRGLLFFSSLCFYLYLFTQVLASGSWRRARRIQLAIMGEYSLSLLEAFFDINHLSHFLLCCYRAVEIDNYKQQGVHECMDQITLIP